MLLTLLGGCAQPSAGDSCSPGTALFDPGPPSGRIFYCTGPMGCEGDAEFHWELGLGPTIQWCGCDGRTQSSDADFGQPPHTRWRWVGSCEDPCQDVFYLDGWSWSGFVGWPVAPQCEECRDAVERAGACIGPDGLSRPEQCCDCSSAIPMPGGACVDAYLGIEISSACCR